MRSKSACGVLVIVLVFKGTTLRRGLHAQKLLLHGLG